MTLPTQPAATVSRPVSPQSLEDINSLLACDDDGKWDRLVPRDELRLYNGRLNFPRRYLATTEGAGCAASRDLDITGWATSQLCQRLSIPSAYFRRCPAPLQDAQANYFLMHPEKTERTDKRLRSSDEDNERQWLLRAKGATLRGILSERYSRIGNGEVVGALAPALREIGYGAVRWFALTDESLHLRLVDPRRIREVLPGDAVIAGLHIANSEVGKRSITVDTMVWRLVCQNGLVRLVKGKSLFSQRHVGLTATELASALPDVIRRAALDGEIVVDKMVRATSIPIEDPEGVVATIASDWTLSQAMEERILASLVAEPSGQQDTLYGLVNAITQTAQSLPPDDRYTLESLAGTILESGPPAVRAESRVRRSRESTGVQAPNDVPLSLFGPDW